MKKNNIVANFEFVQNNHEETIIENLKLRESKLFIQDEK